MQNTDLKGDLQKQSSVYPNGLNLKILLFYQLFLCLGTVLRDDALLDCSHTWYFKLKWEKKEIVLEKAEWESKEERRI